MLFAILHKKSTARILAAAQVELMLDAVYAYMTGEIAVPSLLAAINTHCCQQATFPIISTYLVMRVRCINQPVAAKHKH